MDNKGLITTKELTEILGVTDVTVFRWRKKGLPYKKLGKLVRFELDKVMNWLEDEGRKGVK